MQPWYHNAGWWTCRQSYIKQTLITNTCMNTWILHGDFIQLRFPILGAYWRVQSLAGLLLLSEDFSYSALPKHQEITPRERTYRCEPQTENASQDDLPIKGEFVTRAVPITAKFHSQRGRLPSHLKCIQLNNAVIYIKSLKWNSSQIVSCK